MLLPLQSITSTTSYCSSTANSHHQAISNLFTYCLPLYVLPAFLSTTNVLPTLPFYLLPTLYPSRTMAFSSSVANAAFQASMNLHKISMGMVSMQIDTAASEPTLPDSLVPLTQSFTRSCAIEERCHKFLPKDYPPRAPPADPLDELKALVHRMQSKIQHPFKPSLAFY